MEYLKNHKKITQAEYIKIKDFIIVQLKLEACKGLLANKALSNVKSLLYNNFIEDNIVEKHITYFNSSFNALINHKYNYDSNVVDPILKTLENEVFENFNSTLSTFNTYNIDQEDFKNLTFGKFYPEILKLIVYKSCYSRLDNSIPNLMQAITLFYEIDNYDDFSDSLLQDEKDKITTERIKKIFIRYGRKLKSEAPKKENEIESKNKIDKAEEILRFNISKFSENDKLFLLHICLNKLYNIPLSEAAKIVVITSNIDNLSIFSQETNNCAFYAKLNKGIDQYSGKPKREFIDNIILKLEPFGLININRAVQSIKTRI